MVDFIEDNKIKLLFASEMEKGNFGDLLSRYIVEKISGLEVSKYNYKNVGPHLDAIGSILDREEICAPTAVWGSGFLSPQTLLKIKLTKWRQFLRRKYGKPEVYAVRGKLTRNILLEAGIECPEVYGDPGLLLPCFYKPVVKKKHKVGVVLHNHHRKFTNLFELDGVRLIDINRKYDDIESFVDECAECEVVLSSSLHGLIIANAYKIPCVRLKIANHSIHIKPDREDFKFKDYLTGVNSYNTTEKDYSFFELNRTSVNLTTKKKIDIILNNANCVEFELNLNKLLNAFPIAVKQG